VLAEGVGDDGHGVKESAPKASGVKELEEEDEGGAVERLEDEPGARHVVDVATLRREMRSDSRKRTKTRN
jgi:hypothetical protein